MRLHTIDWTNHVLTVFEFSTKCTVTLLYIRQMHIPKHCQNLQLLIYKQTRHTLARPNAHARQQYLLFLSSAFTQPSTDLSCACSPQRVTQSNSSTSHIHFRWVDAKNVCAVDSHGSKSLIDFDDVDVILKVEIEFTEELGDGEGRANAHYTRSNPGNGGAAEFGEDWLVHLLSCGALHEEDGGR